MARKILITGAKGFIGSNISTYFKKLSFEIYGIGHGIISKKEANHIGIDYWFNSEITLKSLCDINQKFDIIIHCAGSSSVDFSIQNPYLDFKKSVDTTLELLEYIRIHNKDTKLIYPSSSAVYGEHPNYKISEFSKRNPCSPYGFHKKIIEDLCESYSKRYNLNIKIIRLFSVYGKGLRKQLLWDACNKFSNPSKEVVFFGKGNETRDFIHVNDVAKLFHFVLEQKELFLIVNGGNGIKYNIKEIVTKINKLFRVNKQIIFNNISHEGNPIYYWADISILETFNWKSEITFEEGLKEYITWYKNLNQE